MTSDTSLSLQKTFIDFHQTHQFHYRPFIELKNFSLKISQTYQFLPIFRQAFSFGEGKFHAPIPKHIKHFLDNFRCTEMLFFRDNTTLELL